MENKNIRWGIIGCGAVTERKSGPALQNATGSELYMVMRRNEELLIDYAKRHHVPHYTTDAQALIDCPEVDAVYVATPPSSHVDYAIAALRAGKPVYVEKPLSVSFPECQRLIAAQKETGLPVFAAYYRRRLPYFLKVEELLKDGAIGTVRAAQITYHATEGSGGAGDPPWRMVKAIGGGGLLLDVGSHTLDMMDYLLGPIAQVKAFARNQRKLFEVEDTISASLLFENGVLGSAQWCFDSAFHIDENVLTGTLGQLRFPTFGGEYITLVRPGKEPERFYVDTPYHIQTPMVQHVVNCLNKKETPVSTAETAARTTWVMDEILSGYCD